MIASGHTPVHAWRLVLGLLLFPACVGVPQVPEASSTHPASPQAVESPRADSSSVLGGAAQSPAIPPTDAALEMKLEHGGRGK